MADAQSFHIAPWLRTALVILLLAGFSYVVWRSSSFMLGARLFPQYIGTAGIVLCVLELLRQGFRRGREALTDEPSTADLVVEEEEQTLAGYARGLMLFGWMIFYYVLIFLVGFTLATIIFVPALLTFRFRAPLLASASIVGGLVVLIWALQTFLMLRVPRGAIPLPF